MAPTRGMQRRGRETRLLTVPPPPQFRDKGGRGRRHPPAPRPPPQLLLGRINPARSVADTGPVAAPAGRSEHARGQAAQGGVGLGRQGSGGPPGHCGCCRAGTSAKRHPDAAFPDDEASRRGLRCNRR